jgi:hypothetical protein
LATQVDIAPSLGHSIVTAQGLAGGYDAIDDRRFWSAGLQEGALAALAYKVTQRGAGANMSVDVDADDPGGFLVQGDSVTAQGLYFVPPHSGTINLDVAANASGNPRIDSVVLEAKDTTHDASGLTVARARYITGTPTSGATLDNRSGAPALPAGAALLADILVANGAASITNANIRDRRTMARGAFFNDVEQADVNWPAVNAVIGSFDCTLETKASFVAITLGRMRFLNNTGVAQGPEVKIVVDSTVYGLTNGGMSTVPNGGSVDLGAATVIVPVTAGRHRFYVASLNNAGDGSGTSKLQGTVNPCTFSVRELVGAESLNQL